MLKSYEKFNARVVDYDKDIEDLITEAVELEGSLSGLQKQKVASILGKDAEGAVQVSRQITNNQDIASHNREAAEILQANKVSMLIDALGEVVTERDQVVADALDRFNQKAISVANAKAAYLQELAGLGAIERIAKAADDELKMVAGTISKFNGEPHLMQRYTVDVHWDAPTLFTHFHIPGVTAEGMIAMTEAEQKRAYTNKG